MWAKKGTRPILRMCGKRDKVYLCGFAEPITGAWISYLLPALNGDWYSAVLRLLAEHFHGEPIKLIVDGAGWHINSDMVVMVGDKPTSQVPSNITLEVLPAHSPELNPVEQIWDNVRYNYTRNKTFTEPDTLWNTLAQAMRAYSDDPQKVKSITNQEWLYRKKQA